jgi:hypothetical protein
LWVAAGVSAVTATIHVVVGTPEMMGALLAAPIDPVAQQTLRVVWHVTSVLLVSFAVALAWAARADPVIARPLLASVWVLCLAIAVIFLLVGVDAFGAAPFTLPQWVLFLPIVVLIPLARGRSGAGAGA